MESKRKTVRGNLDGGRRNKLTILGKEPGFEYRIVNDDDDRIIDLQERGYEIVNHDVKVGDKRVGVPKKEGTPIQISVGGGKKAYLMRIKDEWYKEDQVAKQELVDELESTLKGNSGGDYGKVQIEQKN